MTEEEVLIQLVKYHPDKTEVKSAIVTEFYKVGTNVVIKDDEVFFNISTLDFVDTLHKTTLAHKRLYHNYNFDWSKVTIRTRKQGYYFEKCWPIEEIWLWLQDPIKIAVSNTTNSVSQREYKYYKYLRSQEIEITFEEFNRLLNEFNLPEYIPQESDFGKIIYFDHEVSMG